MLFYILTTAFSNILVIWFVPEKYLRRHMVSTCLYDIFLMIILLYQFNITEPTFGCVADLNEIFEGKLGDFGVVFALDGISIWFFVLTSILIFLCVLFIENEKFAKQYYACLLVINFLLLLAFSTLNLFCFYIFFEALLIPMVLLIGIWGSRARKIRALYLLFFYTVFGSLLLLLSICYIYLTVGSCEFSVLVAYSFPINIQYFLWISFFIAFASKIPMFPFHIWLPEAHVEAPTVGSVLLAGILLKLGVYGFIRYTLPLFPEASIYFTPLVHTLAILGIIYGSLNGLRQTDLKRIIAYSSIAHMNLIVLGIFSFTITGLEGAILQSISHGFVAGGLFFLVGIIYNRYHSRLLLYYGGLAHVMPLYSGFLLLFTMANIALPGTSSFVGEFLCLIGIYSDNSCSGTIATISVILSGAYSLWLYNRTVFGNLKYHYTEIYKDLQKIEFIILVILSFFVILIGIYPEIFLKYIHLSVLMQFDYLSYGVV